MLDDGPFGLLAGAGQGLTGLQSGRIHVTEGIAAAASADRSGRRTSLLTRRDPSGQNLVTVHTIPYDSEAGVMVYTHLRARQARASANLGEHECIAVCACVRKDLVFVTLDHQAAAIALSELGRGRVASPYELWEELRETVGLASFEVLCRATEKRQQGLPGRPWRLRYT